jgi:hypothetical protein
MPAIRMLNVPVKILLSTTGRRVRHPLVIGIIQVTALGTAGRILQPVAAEGRDVRVAPPAR